MSPRGRAATLHVYLGPRRVGRLARSARGLQFHYDAAWLADPSAIPISLSLPLGDQGHAGPPVQAFFDNLLPDDGRVRQRIATRESAESVEPFDLLAAIGRDCVGALRFLRDGADPDDPAGMHSRPIDEAEIARRLRGLASAPLGRLGEDEDLRISIAGAQDKTALLRTVEGWRLPLGATPTSHILKPPIGRQNDLDLSDSVENEWLGLALCDAFGLPTPHAAIETFEDVKVLVVERFDRRWIGDRLARLHQEDLCQALGVPSARKYERDGGPGMDRVLRLLGAANDPEADQATFLKAQVVFWLLAAVDGHAKNFSIFLTPGGGFRLTPVYDVMTAAPYGKRVRGFSPKRVKLAMAVGRRRRYEIQRIWPRHFLETAEVAGVDPGVAGGVMEVVRGEVDRAMAQVEELLPPEFPGEMFEAVCEAIRLRAPRLGWGLGGV